MTLSDLERFKNLSFDDFRQLALDESLSLYQKIGFPDAYRQGKEEAIFNDIALKLQIKEADERNTLLIDIGPGCSELPTMIINHCSQKQIEVLLIDSKEMLDLLPDNKMVQKFVGYFPSDTTDLVVNNTGKANFIVAYSVFHYVFYHACIYKFIEAALTMLAPGGKFLIGDIPNISKRNRFFATAAGVAYHQKFTATDSLPEISQHYFGLIDDELLNGVMKRYMKMGYGVELLDQPEILPMSNRRQDLLFTKPFN